MQNKFLIRSLRSQPRVVDLPSLEEQRRGMEAMAEHNPPPVEARNESVRIGDLDCEWTHVPGHGPAPLEAPRSAVLYLHGGGFTMGSIATHRSLVARIAMATGVPMLSLDYRLAPEHPFPAALEDALLAYRWLLEQGVTPERLAIAGDSAGGGLVLSTLQRIRRLGLPLPAAGVLLSPWTDLSLSGESIRTKADADPMVTEPGLRQMATAYRGELAPEHEELSPLFADLSGLPPLLVQVGDLEILLDDSLRLVERARAAGVSVELEIGEDLCHVFQFFAPLVPEANEAITRIGAFLRKRL